MTGLFVKSTIARATLRGGTAQDIVAVMRQRWARDPHVAKAAVAAASTTDPTWAGPLVDNGTAEFVGSLSGVSVFYALLANGMRRVPLRTRIGSVIAAPVAYIPGEGMPLPVSRMSFASGALSPIHAGAVIVVSEELLRAADSKAESLFETELRTAVGNAVDVQFLGIATAGVTPTAATADFRADIKSLLNTVAAPGGKVYLVAGQQAANAMTVVEPQGRMADTGGTFLGVPVIVSAAVATDSVIAIQSAGFVGGEDGIEIDTSRQASLEMLDSSLVQNGLSGTGAETVSLFQSNSVAILASAWIGAEKVRDNAAAVLTGVNWSA